MRLCISSNSKDEIGAIITSIEQAKNNLKDIICEVDDFSNEVNNFIIEIKKETAQIGDIVNAITEISEQTNLDEQSGEYLKGIIELTENIQNKIQKSVEMVTITTDKISKGIIQANVVGNNINQIIENVDSVENGISMISKMTVTQSCSIKNVQEFMEEIISIAKVNADKAQEMNTDIEEQMSVLEEVNAISNELENMSVNLTILVSEFKVF